MVDEIILPVNAGKKEKYLALLPQLKALVEGEKDSIANIANVIAALKYGMDFFWVGLYFVKSDSGKTELVLGPFQGPVACTRISFGKGVCGKSWEEKRVIVVDDVDQFPGHIACSSLSRSEIVLPVYKNNEVIAVLDVDSTSLSAFDEIDGNYLEEVCQILAQVI